MNPNPVMQKQQLKANTGSLPSASLVLPFEPKMVSKSGLESSLKQTLAKVERILMMDFSSMEVLPVVKKLQQIFRNLNYATHKKSVAIFVSPLVEKVIYLDIPVEEKIVVDRPFRIRDLVDCRKKGVDYLVLLLGARQSRMYLGSASGLRLIKSNVPQTSYAYLNEVPERVANFSDPSGRKEVMLDKFLHHMDEGLSTILKAYPLPVFVIGNPRVAGHFSSITGNEKNIAGYIHKDGLEATDQEIQEWLKPSLADWQHIRKLVVLKQLEKALENGKLIFGLAAVRSAARFKNAEKLIVERDYVHPPVMDGRDGSRDSTGASSEFFITDYVDGIIQKVLENGGEVEWVDKGELEKYGHIALVKYY